MRLAVALLDAGREDDAKREFRQALALEPPPGLLASAGSALLQAQQYELAQAYLEQAVAEQPAARLDLAIAIFHIRGAKAGLEELDKLRGVERNGDYWLARAQMLEGAGQFEEAVQTLNRGFQAEPTRPDLYYEASLLLIQHDRITEAVRLLEQATHKLPDDPELALQQAIVLELAAQSDEAGKKLSAIERRWPEWDRPWLIHGIITASHWKPADARKRIESAVALGSDEPQTWFYLAEAILNSGGEDVARARQAARRALELAPDDPYVQTLAGRVELAQGNVEGAIGHLRRAVELLPTLAEAHVQLSRALSQAGRADEAAKEGEIVRKLSEEQSAAAPSPSVKKDLFRLKGK